MYEQLKVITIVSSKKQAPAALCNLPLLQKNLAAKSRETIPEIKIQELFILALIY